MDALAPPPSIEPGLDVVRELLDEIIALARPAAGAAGDAVAHLVRLAEELVGRLGALAAAAGSPEALRAVGADWSGGIGATAGRQAGCVTEAMLRVDDHWAGAAADAYADTLAPQQDALAAVKAVTDALDAVLVDMAGAIGDFWWTVAIDLVALATVLVGALATGPFSPAIAATAIGGFGTGLAATAYNLHGLLDTAAASAAELDRRIADDVAFPGGAWPRSTADPRGAWQPR